MPFDPELIAEVLEKADPENQKVLSDYLIARI
jgi:hypothetical protein